METQEIVPTQEKQMQWARARFVAMVMNRAILSLLLNVSELSAVMWVDLLS